VDDSHDYRRMDSFRADKRWVVVDQRRRPSSFAILEISMIVHLTSREGLYTSCPVDDIHGAGYHRNVEQLTADSTDPDVLLRKWNLSSEPRTDHSERSLTNGIQKNSNHVRETAPHTEADCKYDSKRKCN
jgi:hypothetical protein